MTEGCIFDDILKVELRDSVLYPGVFVSRCGNFVRNMNNSKNPVTKVHGRTEKFTYLQSGGLWIHRLVAASFVHNPNPGKWTTVDHINSDKQDNRAENLRWVSTRLNCIHRQRKRYYHRVRCRNGRVFYTSQIKSGEETIKLFSPTKELAIEKTKKLIDDMFRKVYYESLSNVSPGLPRRANMFLWTDSLEVTPGRSVENHSGNERVVKDRRPVYSL